jgi:hypothetical protein
MATPEQQLLGSMNPQLARLLDEQLAGQQAAQGVDQGYQGIVSSAVQGATMLGNIGRDAFGLQRQLGPNEMQALQTQEKQKALTDAMLGAEGPDRIAKMRDMAQRLRDTGAFEAIMKAEQIDAQADELAYKMGTLQVNRQKAIGNAKGFQSFEGEHFRDEDGNIYATVTSVNKDTNEVTTKYTPLTGGPEYDGKSKLVPVQKTGGGVGLTAMEYADMVAVREGKVETQKQFSRMKAESAASYRDNQSTVRDLERAVELVKEEMSKGNLQGGISANVANAVYKLTGTMPKNLAELNNIFGEATYSRLKPLFGGVISEGERQSVEDLYFSITKSGQVNLALLDRFLGKAKGALVNHNILLSSDNMDQYTQRLIDGGLVGEEKSSKDKSVPKGPIKVWTANGWEIK